MDGLSFNENYIIHTIISLCGEERLSPPGVESAVVWWYVVSPLARKDSISREKLVDYQYWWELTEDILSHSGQSYTFKFDEETWKENLWTFKTNRATLLWWGLSTSLSDCDRPDNYIYSMKPWLKKLSDSPMHMGDNLNLLLEMRNQNHFPEEAIGS